MTDIPALIAKLEGLEGPSREVDVLLECYLHPEGDIATAIGSPRSQIDWTDVGNNWKMNFQCGTYFASLLLPKRTASLDAAVALAEKKLPGWKKHFYDAGMYGAERPTAHLSEPDFASFSRKNQPYRRSDGSGFSLAVALLIALLRSLSQEGSGE